MNISCLFKKLYKFQKRKPYIYEMWCLKYGKILKIIMSKRLTKVQYWFLDIHGWVKSKSICFFLFLNPFTIYTFAHYMIKVLNRNRWKIENLDYLNLHINWMGRCPCLNHCVHHFIWIFVNQNSHQINNEILYTLFNLESTHSWV